MTEPARIATVYEPRDFQFDGFHLIDSRPATMLAWGMGAGKTKVIVDWIANRLPSLVYVACPKAVVRVWPKEFAKHVHPDLADRIKVHRLDSGSVKKRADAMTKAIQNARPGRATVIVLNYESAWREPIASIMLRARWDLGILDESHRVKDARTKVSGHFIKLGKKTDRRVCLTGTPMPNSPLDIFGQYGYLDQSIFGRSFISFRNTYAVMGGPLVGGRQVMVVGYKNLEQLHDRIFTIAHRVTREHVKLSLPPENHVPIEVELSPKSRRVYRQLDESLVAEAEGGVISAANALVKTLRLQQATGGFGVVSTFEATPNGLIEIEAKHTERFGTEKIDALVEWLGDLDPVEPVVVIAKFKPDLDAIAEAAVKSGRRFYELSGRRDDLDAWAARPKPATVEAEGLKPPKGEVWGDVLGVQIQAGGVGVDFTRSAYCIFYSIGHSLGDYEQALARILRTGQDRPVIYGHLVAEGTVDEDVYVAVESKASIVETVMERRGIKLAGKAHQLDGEAVWTKRKGKPRADGRVPHSL
jgi:SNF2 family DNA or RNA helicase